MFILLSIVYRESIVLVTAKNHIQEDQLWCQPLANILVLKLLIQCSRTRNFLPVRLKFVNAKKAIYEKNVQRKNSCHLEASRSQYQLWDVDLKMSLMTDSRMEACFRLTKISYAVVEDVTHSLITYQREVIVENLPKRI